MEVIVNLWAVLLAAGLPAGTNPGVLLTPSVGDLSTLHEQVNSTTANHLDGVELYSRVPGQGSMVGQFHFASDFDKLEGSLRNLRGCFWTFWQQEVALCWKQKATFPNGKTKMNAFGGSITSYHS